MERQVITTANLEIHTEPVQSLRPLDTYELTSPGNVHKIVSCERHGILHIHRHSDRCDFEISSQECETLVGIDVDNNNVTYNGTHQHRVDTCPIANPRSITISGGLVVKSIFRRLVSNHGDGDGNPLIYALKSKKGFTICPREAAKFLPDFNSIVAKALHGQNGVSFITMPSSHKISQILAKRAARHVAGALVVNDLFLKKTLSEVYADLKHVKFDKSLKKDGKKLLDDLLKYPNATFSMKDVKNSELRKLINPVKLSGRDVPALGCCILVDDLLSTGSTLSGAHTLLMAQGLKVPVSGLCLLGQL
jgi:hypothetical protein